MTCDRITAALVEGRPLSAPEAAHLAGCATCRRLSAAVQPMPAVVSIPGPRAPTPDQLNRRLVVRHVRTVAAFSLAAGVLAALLPWPGGTPAPEAPLVAVSTDTGGVEAAAEDDLVVPLDAAELIAAAGPATGADEALLAVLAGLDHVDDAHAELPGAGLVALLDPYDSSPDPLLNLGDL